MSPGRHSRRGQERGTWRSATRRAQRTRQSSAIALGSLLLLGRATLRVYVDHVAALRERCFSYVKVKLL